MADQNTGGEGEVSDQFPDEADHQGEDAEQSGGGNVAGSPAFRSLSLYKDLSPVVARTLRMVTSIEEFDPEYDFILEELHQDTMAVLPMLADGYNRYYAGDKAAAYREVRSTISRVQSYLFLLNDLGYLNNAPVYDICTDFEDKISHLNGLIRTMEERDPDSGTGDASSGDPADA